MGKKGSVIMAFDGVFAHYMLAEINDQLIGKRISKVEAINDTDYAFSLSSKMVLVLSADKNFSHFRLSKKEFMHTDNHFGNILKKYFASSFIDNLIQTNNDRVITLIVTKNDELGYPKTYKLVFEFTGKTSNFIILDSEDIIIEAYHKHFEIDTRIISPNVKYELLESTKINPFTLASDDTILNENIYEGVSKLLFSECCYNASLLKTINQLVSPTLIIGKKVNFYCFDLKHLDGKRIKYDDLSSLVEGYIDHSNSSLNENADEKLAKTYCIKELEKAKSKLAKQNDELRIAKNYASLERDAQLLASNIHLVKPYQEEIKVIDYNTNEIVTLPLNTKISPNENVNYYFNKVKKQKRTVDALSEQIEKTKQEIIYLETLLNQISIASNSSLKEICKEIGLVKPDKRPLKPLITRYIDEDGYTILVGKNNTQNNYITNKLAKATDYFFHIASYPGCHVIYNGPLNDDKIKLVANICVYHSKKTSIMAVDYVQVKYLKKVKGESGSFVTYTNQKTTHVNGDIDYINKHAKLVN
ncbi:MAG: NFACT family protein [Bacilli bacterium]|nr:NFACT family protein [Bacilli bacterium]